MPPPPPQPSSRPAALARLAALQNSVGAGHVKEPVTVLPPREQFLVSCRVVWSDDTVDVVISTVHAWTPQLVLVGVSHHATGLNHLAWVPVTEVTRLPD